MNAGHFYCVQSNLREGDGRTSTREQARSATSKTGLGPKREASSPGAEARDLANSSGTHSLWTRIGFAQRIHWGSNLSEGRKGRGVDGSRRQDALRQQGERPSPGDGGIRLIAQPRIHRLELITCIQVTGHKRSPTGYGRFPVRLLRAHNRAAAESALSGRDSGAASIVAPPALAKIPSKTRGHPPPAKKIVESSCDV